MMVIRSAGSAGAREMLLVVGLAAVGLLMVAAVTFGSYIDLHTQPGSAPVVEVSFPEAPLP